MNKAILLLSLSLSFSAFSQEVVKSQSFAKVHSEAVVNYSVEDLTSQNNLLIFDKEEVDDNLSGRLYMNVPKKVDGLKVLDAKLSKIKDISDKHCDVEIGDGQRFAGGELELTIEILPKKGIKLTKELAQKCYISAIKNNAFMRKLSFNMDLELAKPIEESSKENNKEKQKKKSFASAQ